MKYYRYTLQPYKGYGSRFLCPNCGDKGRTFVRYIDNVTGDYIHETVGKCNRVDKCGYWLKHTDYFERNGITDRPTSNSKALLRPQKPKPPSYISIELFRATLSNKEPNNFITYLQQLTNISAEQVKQVIAKYFIGTSNHWKGSTVFYQIDSNGNIRAGKVMLYDANTGKRVKRPFNHINWLHTAFKMPDYNLVQCFFGQHLLSQEPKNTIAIVEGEKTAIIASMHYPLYTWLACGGKEGLSEAKLSALKGRRVILFPDLGSLEKWKAIAEKYKHIVPMVVSDLLEKKATPEQIAQGLDLADFLVRPP